MTTTAKQTENALDAAIEEARTPVRILHEALASGAQLAMLVDASRNAHHAVAHLWTLAEAAKARLARST